MSKRIDPEQMRIDILRDLSASGMIPYGRVSLEVLYLMPKEFTDNYVDLFFKALREDAKGVDYESRAGELTDKTYSKDKGRAKGRAKATMGVGHGEGSKRYRNAWVIRSEKALKVKTDIDRELRRLSGDIEQGLTGKGKSGSKMRQCPGTGGAGCGKFVRNEWRYCPSCGASIK